MNIKQLEIKRKSGTAKVRCPECEDRRSNKSDKSLSVDLNSGLYKCHYCEAKGILDEYKKVSHFSSEEKSYTLPKLNTTGLGDEQLAYLLKRGITGKTVNRNKITQSAKGWLEFNYFEHSELVNVKYRSIRSKKFMQHKGGKPILYGLNDIIGEESVIIVEGEIDKLSIEEAGYRNCVSVPLGAPNANDQKVDSKLRCFVHAEDYFTDDTRIIIAVDNDNNGKRLKEEIARRFGKHRCKWVDFGEFKDANDVLIEKGADFLKALIVQARPFPIDGVIELGDIWEKVINLYEHGAPECYSAGMGDAFDDLYKIAPGFLSVITGAPTSGKSNFVENICYNLMVSQGWKLGLFSPEHPEELEFQRFARMRTDKHFFEGVNTRMDHKELIECATFFRDKLFIVKHKSANTVDVILDTLKQLVFKYGINMAVIDPWTDVEHDHGGKNETAYVAAALARIKDFAREYSIHVFLIAHPTKPRKGKNGKYIKPTMYDISGSANFYNKADGGLIVHREDDNSVSVDIKKVKFENIHGKKGTGYFRYDIQSCTYSETDGPEEDSFLEKF